MSRILVSGLINLETNIKIRDFPINYYPIDYSFFGVKSSVGGVGYNIAKSLSTLGDNVSLVSMLGNDFESQYVKSELAKLNVNTENISSNLKETPTSAVLFDSSGKRQIYCDLKDIQEKMYDCKNLNFDSYDIFAICNINFNRQLLKAAKENGKIIVTDVHCLSNIYDEYNSDFMRYADILFLSDELVPVNHEEFLLQLANEYDCKIIVLSQGSKGVLMYVQNDGCIYDIEAVKNDNVVNTVGAGDSLYSSFIHFYAKGFSPLECIKYAQAYASNKISFNGASQGFISETELFKIAKPENIIHSVIDIKNKLD